jgi:two-component system, OmpR family, phosphate regulon response regulator PhoB
MLLLFSNEIMPMQGKTILVVEDEAPIREMLRFALSRAEYRVVEAASAQ